MKLKKGVKYVILGIIILFVLSLMFCGRKSLIGTWRGEMREGDMSAKVEFTFRKNGSGLMASKGPNGEIQSDPFTFEMFGDNKFVLHVGMDDSEWDYTIKGRTLTMTNQYGESLKLKKKIF